MEIKHINSIKGKDGGKNFIGKVDLKTILDEHESKEQEMYYVSFKKGARTRLHYHLSEQILIATKGKGVVVIFEKISSSRDNELEKSEVCKFDLDGEKYDTFCVPAGKLHWHGAREGKDFDHIAIRKVTTDSSEAKTIWL